MQLSFSFLAVATAFAAAAGLSLVSAHPAQQLKRVTTPPPSPTSTTALGGDAGIPTHASTVTNALPAAIKTTPPSSCTFFFFLFSFLLPTCLLSFFSQRGEKIFPLDNILRAGPPLSPPPPQMIYFYPSKNERKVLSLFTTFFSFPFT